MTKRATFALIVLSSAAGAETYVPVGVDGPAANPGTPKQLVSASNLAVKGLGLLVQSIDTKGLKSTNQTAQFAVCATPPSVVDIGGNFELRRSVMTRNAAANLNILAGIGKVDTEGSGSQLIAIFDFSRFKDCLATDGKTTVVYGQAVRTIMSFESTDAKSNVTFPLVAAAATVSGKSSSISVSNLGFDEPTMALKANELSSISLSVENFAEFTKIHKQLIDLAAAENSKKKVERLGIVPAVDEDDLIDTLPKAFAIQQIKDNRSCENAKLRYKNAADADGLKILTSTYISVVGSCSTAKPGAQVAAKAKDYLRGMKVSN